MGDQCLQDLAFLLQDVTRRPGDAVARLGGDEFAAILLDATEDGAAQVAEALRAKIEDQTSFSASFGVTSLIPVQERFLANV